jgi:hypothetical protein
MISNNSIGTPKYDSSIIKSRYMSSNLTPNSNINMYPRNLFDKSIEKVTYHSQLQEKLSTDSKLANSTRLQEDRLKEELEKSKALLIEKSICIDDFQRKKLDDMKNVYDSVISQSTQNLIQKNDNDIEKLLRDSEDEKQKIIEIKNVEISKLKYKYENDIIILEKTLENKYDSILSEKLTQYNNELSQMQKLINDKDNITKLKFDEKETHWKTRYDDLVKVHESFEKMKIKENNDNEARWESEFETLNISNSESMRSMTNHLNLLHEEKIHSLAEQHEIIIKEIKDQHINELENKDIYWKGEIESLKSSHKENVVALTERYGTKFNERNIENQNEYELREIQWEKEIVQLKLTHEEIGRLMTEKYSNNILEKEKEFKLILQEKDENNNKINIKINNIDGLWEERFRMHDKKTLEQLEEQENEWKLKMNLIQEKCLDSSNVLENKLKLEKEAHDLATQARITAKEDQLKHNYEKRILKFEKQVQEAQKSYATRQLVLQGSMEESRREIIALRNQNELQLKDLREELLLKEQRLASIEEKLAISDEMLNDGKKWIYISKELSNLVIKACSTVKKAVQLPSPALSRLQQQTMGGQNTEYVSELLRGFTDSHYSFEANLNDSRRHSNDENNLKVDINRDVLIEKKNLAKALKLSNKIIQSKTDKDLPKSKTKLI